MADPCGHNNTDYGILADIGGKFYNCQAFSNGDEGFIGNSSAVFLNCLAYFNGGYQIKDTVIGSTVIANCTVDGGNIAEGIYLAGDVEAVVNTIIYNCTTGIIGSVSYSDSTIISRNNLFFSNTADRTNWPSDVNDVTADPLFTAEGSDYTLQDGSPALAAGTDAGDLGAGSGIDIGALQQVPEAEEESPEGYRVTLDNTSFEEVT